MITTYEAIARGAIEAQVKIAASHPKAPADKIMDALVTQKDKTKSDIEIEWSTNQKVANEIVLAGMMSKARSLAILNHVGINIAADAFMTGCYAGAYGGCVILSNDDPGMYYGQNEIDNRYYGLHGLIPVFEPSSAAEAKEMMKFSFEFSEEYESLVLFRTTSQLLLSKSDIEEGNITDLGDRQYKFDESQRERWVHLPTGARVNRGKLLQRLKDISAYAEEFPFNKVEENKGSNIGIITSGYTYTLLKKVLKDLKIEPLVSVYKLGMTYPLPEKKLAAFMENHSKILVIEELEPIHEQYLKHLAHKKNITTEIKGKELFSNIGLISEKRIANTLSSFMNTTFDISLIKDAALLALKEEFNNTQYGKYSAIYDAISNVASKKEVEFIHTADFDAREFGPNAKINAFIAKGGSVSLCGGIAKFDPRPTLSYMTDVGFLHSGFFGVINAVYNKVPMIIFILPNQIPNADGNTMHSDKFKQVQKMDLKKFVLGLEIAESAVFQPDANSIEEIEDSLVKCLQLGGVRVIIPQYAGGNK